MLCDFTLSELSIGWVKSYWMAYWLFWMLLNCHKLYMICKQSDFFLSELFISWLESLVLNYQLIVLNVAELSQALVDLYAGWFYPIWTVYWVTGVLLNCIIDVAELPQALGDFYGGWFYFIWIVYWVFLNCIWLYCISLNCHRHLLFDELTAAVLSSWWLVY